MSDTESYGPLNGRPAPMPVEELRSILSYNPETGGFRWAVDRGCNANRMKAGSIAGSLKSHGYVAIKINGVFYRAHRLAWYISTGEWPAPDIEIDGRLKVFPPRATAEEAHADYVEAARVHHGAFARTA